MNADRAAPPKTGFVVSMDRPGLNFAALRVLSYDLEMTDNVANENSTRWLEADPNIRYVTDYTEKMLAHFKDCKVAPTIVAMCLTDALIKLSPGKPYDKLPDEGDLREGLSYLTPTIHDLQNRVDAHYRALDRIQQRRLEELMARHGCTVEEAHRIWVAAESDPTVLKTGLPAASS